MNPDVRMVMSPRRRARACFSKDAPPSRGHYFARHQARVVARGDLLVIEFVSPAPKSSFQIVGRRLRRACAGFGTAAVALTARFSR